MNQSRRPSRHRRKRMNQSRRRRRRKKMLQSSLHVSTFFCHFFSQGPSSSEQPSFAQALSFFPGAFAFLATTLVRFRGAP